MACWKLPSRCDGAYSVVSSVLGVLPRLGKFGRSRIVGRRFLGVGSRFFAALSLLLLLLMLPLLLDIHCGAFEMERGTDCAGAVRMLLTSRALWTTPSLFAVDLISALVSSLVVAVEQQQHQSSDADKISPHPST